ncbi:gamma-aminobutyric acid type B receptor subunit 1-like [Haliotis cracherodii]|uniref:gamma-aminobutyric acid type B receptor subunit 1-like n=1 Tax=Haliotis cracherodii TaxID=6455 RepID=UPI0039EC8330
MANVFLLVLLSTSSVAGVKDLYILGLFPMDGPSWPGGRAIKAAADIALEHVNAMDNMLEGYDLTFIWNNTRCNTGIGVNSMYRNLYNPPTKVIIYGPGCSFVTEATAQASHMWNLVQISWGSISPALSDKTKFPRFFRANPPEVEVNPARIQLFKRFNWHKIATIHESYELFSAPTEDLLHRIQDENMTVIRSEIITKDPAFQVANLKESDARIIVGSFYEGTARKVFCEAYKNNLYGPKIVWITAGWYEDKWWTTADESIDCTPEQLAVVVEGSIGVSRVLLNPRDEVTVSGIRPSEFMKLYNARSENGSWFASMFASLSYDSILAISLALNTTQGYLAATESNLTLQDFSYTDDTIGSIIFQSMKDVHFTGMAGHLSFNEKGDPIGLYTINRIQGGQSVMVGLYDPTLQSSSQVDWLPETDPIVWQDGKIPRDAVLKLVEVEHLFPALYICFCCVSGLGATLSVFFLVFNIYYRDLREVKMSSPRLNNFTLIGCLLLYMTPFLENTSATSYSAFCTIKAFFLTLGFSLSFGALFAKTWRVHVIFTNSTKKKKIVKDGQLMAMVGALVAINTLVLLTWAFLDPIVVVDYDLPLQRDDKEDVITQRIVKLCESPNQIYFTVALFALQGILMLLGAFLAWETRKVKLDGLNDSKMIGMSVYNVLVLSLLGVTVSMALRTQVNINYALTSTVVILATTVTQCLIFVPKVLSVKNIGNQVDDVGDMMAAAGGRLPTVAGTMMTSSAVTAHRLITVEKTLHLKNLEVERLKAELEKYKKTE